jgi:pilus assembly protein Flp/PilA
LSSLARVENSIREVSASPASLEMRTGAMLFYVRRFLEDESGPTAVEYAVMLALILAVVIIAISSVGGSTAQKWNNNSQQIIGAVNGAIGSS